MSRDILFREPDFVFSFRVGGIAAEKGKILLQRPPNDDCAIIGGHVEALETAADALKREFREELHTEIEVKDLLAVGEIFFPWGEKPCHQICFYYRIDLLGEAVPRDGVFRGYDELEQKRIDLDYCWVPLEDLEKGLKVYPLELIPYLLNDPGQTVHFVCKEENESP